MILSQSRIAWFDNIKPANWGWCPTQTTVNTRTWLSIITRSQQGPVQLLEIRCVQGLLYSYPQKPCGSPCTCWNHPRLLFKQPTWQSTTQALQISALLHKAIRQILLLINNTYICYSAIPRWASSSTCSYTDLYTQLHNTYYILNKWHQYKTGTCRIRNRITVTKHKPIAII